MRMRRWSSSPQSGTVVLFLLGVVVSLALGGCGGSGVAATAGAGASVIPFTSPSIVGREATGSVSHIPVRYTCDGANTPPSFKWGRVPPSAASLVLFLFKVERTTPFSNGRVKEKVKIAWTVAGISPGIHEIPAGKLPRGAFLAGKRYSICPPRGSAATYVFQLVALSSRPVGGPHLDVNKLFKEAESSEVAAGFFSSSYKRI